MIPKKPIGPISTIHTLHKYHIGKTGQREIAWLENNEIHNIRGQEEKKELYSD